MNLQEYKRAYPQFSEWDDEVLVNRLYREEGRKAGLSFDDFSKAVGFASEPEVAAKNTGLLSTIGEGVKSVGRAARATFNLHQGDTEDLTAIGNDAKAALSNEDARLTAFKQDIQARKERLGEDPSWLQTGLELLSAAANNPSGAGLMLAEQLPNSAAAMAGGYAGMQAGAIAGPVGAVAGGIVGMFGANYMLEGGNKAIEAAQAGQLSPDDMDRVKGEGLTKAGIITGVDVATMGLGSKLFGATQRAVDRAGARVLAEAGVDATDRAAINAAVRANPALAGAVMDAEKLAFDAATTVGQRAMRGAAGIGLETFGEGLGEYVGEGVATGKWDKMEAMLEAFSSLGQSAAESVFVANRNDVAMTAQPILNAQTADEAIAIAQERVSADLTSAVTDYQSLFASAAPSGSFDQLVQNELNPVAATQLGEDQALQNYLRNTDTDTLVRDLVHADQASFERIIGGLSARAADVVLNDVSSALRSATDEQLAQSPGWAAQIEMQRRRELQTEQAYNQQSEQQIAAERQKAHESGQIAEQARDQQVDLQTTISQVNEAPAAPTVMEQAMAGAQQGPSKQEQLRLEQARIRQQLQQTRDANRTQAAQLADNEAGNFSTARQARPADGEAAPLSAPANNTENAKSLSRMMNGAPVADVTVQALSGKFDSIPRLMAQTAQKIGKMFGRQVVFFEGGIADGAAPQMRDDKRIFINIKQGAINPLSILGHEMMHRMRIESPKAYQTLVKAVRESGIITDEMLADYDADYNSKDYTDLSPEQADAKRAEVLAKIKSDKKTADFLLEEMLSDLNGNRFTEADFWSNVFQTIEEREGREAAKPIIARLREALIMAINRLMTAMKTLGKDGKFGADQQIMDHLGEVKSALEEAFATYMQEMKDGGSGQLSVPGAENRGQAQRADMAGGMADAGMAGGESAGRSGVPAGAGAADPEAGAAGGEGGGGLRYSGKRDDASAHRMQIAREERELADKTKLTRDELKLVTQYAREFGLPSRTVEMEVRRIKANFPESAGWAPLTFLRVDRNTMSKKATEKTPLPAQAIFFEPYGYQFHLDQNGKDSNESREKRVSDIAAKLAGEITAKYMAAQNGDKNADVVMRQADWYRALRAKLRATFGGFGDFLAQLLGPTSANNPVEPNFKYGVEALKMATSGKWDNMFREVFAWKADMDAAASNLDALVNEFNDKIADMKSAANERWGVKSNKEKTLYIKEQTKKIKGEYESRINSAAEALKSASKYKGTLPVRENGKMFGMASEQIAHILGDVWGDKVHGDAPKTKNYYQNIMGRTIEATIDVWAARTLRRIANDVIGNLPRIPPVAETAVAGQVLVDNVTSGSEFGFGQDVFRKAAEDLRKSGIPQFKDATPDAVQAMVWFIEKETWATRNWTTKIGEEGSIEHEMLLAGYADREQVDAWRVAARAGKPNTETKAYLRKNGEFNEAKYAKDVAKWEEAKAIGKEMLAKIERYPDRFVAGITTEIPGDKPTNAEMAGTAREIEAAIADDKIMAMRSQTSTGEFMRDIERTLDTEFVARNGYDAMPVWDKLVEIADREGQMATFLSRVLRADETVNPLVHRPGVEVYFAKPISKFDAAALMATINDADVHGLTLITEGRRSPPAMRGEEQPIVGIRMQHIPEFSMGQGGYESGMSDAKIEARVKKARQVMRRLVRQLSERSDIATVALHWYETRTHFYGNPEGNTGAGSGRGAGGSWSGQSIGEALASADRFSRNNQAKLDAKREELRAARQVSRGDSEQARFSLPRSDAGSAQRAGASDAQAGGEVPGYGAAAPGAIAVQGFHYSTAERSQLDGRYYGTGTKGAEYPRVMSSRDPRIKERIYFYVDAGRGITPEQGVGSVGHTVNLNNIYDATNDTWLQAKMGRDFDSNDAWLNAFESAVIDNGFDGYVSDFGTQRAAVLLGRHSVKVQPTQATRGANTSVSNRSNTNGGADAVAKSRVLPGGRMSGADWKRMVPAVVPGADVSMLEDGKDYYKDDVVAAMRGVKYSLARSVESGNGLPNQADGNRTLDGAELKALRRAAANIERPRDGVFLRVTEDGKAIATGPKGTRVPDRFIRFAEENGLAFEARRDGRGRQRAGDYPMGGDITSKTEPMPAEYRESGAMYFGEGNVFYDRTGMSRFSLSRTPSASAQKEIAAIEGRLAKSPSDFVAKNLENIKRGLAGEVVRDENGNLLAPNGRKSKLTEQQYLQVRTPEFMNWFGDWLSFHNAKNGNGVWEDDEWAVSKVVDENGEPALIYHGSVNGGFTKMDPLKGDKHRSPMIFATDSRKMARSYSWKNDEIDLSTPEFSGTVVRKIDDVWVVGQRDADPDLAYNVYGELVDALEAEGYPSKKEAMYFRDNELAQYLRDQGKVQQGVYSVFLNIRNPNEYDMEGANWDGQVFDKYEVKTPGPLWESENIYGPNGERLMDHDTAENVANEFGGEIVEAIDLDVTTNSIAEEAKRMGNDGAIIRNVIDDGGQNPGDVIYPANVFVIFDSNQAKSATQNVGTFSTTNDDLRYSPARNILGNNLQQAWSAPNMGKMDDFIYTMQDKQVDMKRVIESIKAAVGSIADKWNPYLKEELFHGRSAKGVKDFMDFELRPLLQEMKMRGVEMAEFEKYLHNRHAEERNRQVARVNPNMPDAGSGIKTADARAYMAALDPQKRQRLDALARRIDTITSSTLDLLEREGLETPQTIAKLRAAYKYYVPLKRDMGGDGLFGMGTGQGYSVRGASSKRAMGSEKDVVDILANIAMQRERAIVRVEKNRVAQALYGLAIQNPNGDFWAPVDPGKNIQQTVNMLVNLGMNPIDAQGVAKEQKQRYIDPRTGLVAERINPVLRNADNVLAVRINGEDKYLFFSETDARAQRMVHALKNLDADQLGRVMSIMGKATRYFASINTQYNPIFGIINIIRDAQGALLNLSTTPIAGKQKEVLGNTISAMRGIYADIRDHRKGRVPSSQWAQLWEEFQQVGGQTGYKDMFSRSEERAEALEKELKKIGEGKLKAAGRAIFDWLSDYNETLENATRLAAYKVAKDQGMSNDQAASLAKNLTVNFNRKGQVATQAGALYAFFNANVQGTARLVETLKGKSGKKIITGGLLLGSMQAVLLAMAGYDDDEPPAFVRERNLILPLGDHYLTLPMPLGFHVIPSMARIPTEFVLSGFKNPTKRIGEMFGLFADTFNPIGGAGISLQTIAPTVVDPFAALAENRDWTGKQIAKMDRSSTDPTPGHARAKDTASEFSKVLSSWINAASGGTKYKQGLISPTPDQLDYLIGQATGGVGREYLKAEQVATSAATGEELPLYKVPLLGRFVGETQGQGPEGGKFYSAVTRLNEHEAEIKGLRSEGKFAEAQAYIAENPEASMVQMANAAEKRVADLRKQKRQLLERDASPERIKLVEQQITATMRRFNEQVKLRAEQ